MGEQDEETTIYNALEVMELSIITDIKATNPGSSTHAHEYMESCAVETGEFAKQKVEA